MTNLQINTLNNVYIPQIRTNRPAFGSANNPVQQTDTIDISHKKDSSRNWGIKLLCCGLAIGGALLAFTKLHKTNKVQEIFKSDFKNINDIRKNLSEIFEKDLTEKEADELAKNYKRICGIKNDDEFVKELFGQLKKDYGFENSHLKLSVKDFNSTNVPKWAAGHADLGHLVTISRIDGKYEDRKTLFGTLFHEMKHHKQFETAIAADITAYEDAIAHKKVREYTQQQIDHVGGEHAVLTWLKENIRPYLQPEFERVRQETGELPKDSALYKKGLEYIEATKKYIQEGEIITRNDDYNSNILEKEAHRVGKLAKDIFDNLNIT